MKSIMSVWTYELSTRAEVRYNIQYINLRQMDMQPILEVVGQTALAKYSLEEGRKVYLSALKSSIDEGHAQHWDITWSGIGFNLNYQEYSESSYCDYHLELEYPSNYRIALESTKLLAKVIKRIAKDRYNERLKASEVMNHHRNLTNPTHVVEALDDMGIVRVKLIPGNGLLPTHWVEALDNRMVFRTDLQVPAKYQEGVAS